MVKKIKFWPAPQMEVRVDVTEQMIRDYRECRRMFEAGENKDCDTCSWHEVEIPDTRMCELDAMEKLLEEDHEQINTPAKQWD